MAKVERSVRGRVIAITGGARGIGNATARTLAREGARIAIGDLDGDLATEAAAALGEGHRGYQLDVTDRASFASFIDAVERDMGPLDVIVNNAGIMQIGRLDGEDDATTRRMIDINLHGVITGTKLALERMAPRRSGHIINVASSAGKFPFANGATYCATKFAVVGFTESVAREYQDVDIEFSLVMPGIVNTELAGGLHQTRGVKVVEPEDVAAEILDALRTPRMEIFVPRNIKGFYKLAMVLPRKGTEVIAKITKGDTALSAADASARAAYEDRASHSEPALEARAKPAPEPATNGASETEPAQTA
jgi:NAD(P)-dependent dehydrogenase (short-subunit alcohol dehydrogenase family)